MISFKQFVVELMKEDVAANCMGSGQIATFDPVMFKKIIKRKQLTTGK